MLQNPKGFKIGPLEIVKKIAEIYLLAREKGNQAKCFRYKEGDQRTGEDGS